jgi:hypothetical protein
LNWIRQLAASCFMQAFHSHKHRVHPRVRRSGDGRYGRWSTPRAGPRMAQTSPPDRNLLQGPTGVRSPFQRSGARSQEGAPVGWSSRGPGCETTHSLETPSVYDSSRGRATDPWPTRGRRLL